MQATVTNFIVRQRRVNRHNVQFTPFEIMMKHGKIIKNG